MKIPYRATLIFDHEIRIEEGEMEVPLMGAPWGRDLTPDEENEQLKKHNAFWAEQGRENGKTQRVEEQDKPLGGLALWRQEEEAKREEQEYQKFLKFLRRALSEHDFIAQPLDTPAGSFPGWRLD